MPKIIENRHSYNRRLIGSRVRTSYVSNHFYCRIQLVRPLYDAERDLLAIAKFLVVVRVEHF